MRRATRRLRPSGADRLREFWVGQIDLAPLSLFRILYGLQLFNWVWQLYPNLTAFFTDEGILPRRSLMATFADRWSLLDLVGLWWQVAIFWVLALVVAVLLTIGWRSRLMSFFAFIVVTSFSFRDPLILDGSDLVFRLVPLWMAFSDPGARYSIDAMARNARGQRTGRGFALPVRILELQVAWIYLATGLEKMTGALWPQGIATYYSLQLEHTFGRAWAKPIAENLLLARVMSWGTLAIELAFLPLVIIPSRITRVLAVLLAAGLHLGILVLMNVGNFPVIMLSSLVLFLPPQWVDGWVAGVASIARARLAPRAVALADGAAHTAAEALPPPITLPAALRRPRRIVGAVALTALALIAFASAVPSSLEAIRPKGAISDLLRFAAVDQKWDMFSPEPARSDGWMLIPGTLTDGTTLDLLTAGPADDSRERYSDPLYSRWTKVFERIASSAYTDYRLEYARHICRTTNLHLRPGEVPIQTFDVHYVERLIAAPGEGPPTFRDIKLWSHRC
ncbi:MAG: HTTM domain-containing protein [Chloroflexota bacterium]|nr:HTTM domain-containing protein [Chloroflexota bacterium]